MPQWVQLPPNLLPEKHTIGKSIYTTDYSSKRPGFQLHLQKARGFNGSRHHPPVPKVYQYSSFSFHLNFNKHNTDWLKIPKLTQRGDFEWLFLCSTYRLPIPYLVKVLVIISLSKISFFHFQKPDRKTMRASQTGNYLNFKEDFERALSTVSTDRPRDFRLNVDITTPDASRTTGIFK